MGTNTDPYQPLEKKLRITRSILEVLRDFRHPVAIVTKSPLILGDLDILSEIAAMELAKAALFVTTLDRKLARVMEPRAGTPARRLQAVRGLTDAGISAGVMFTPAIPALNDHEMEVVLEAAKAAGSRSEGYVPLRLPPKGAGHGEQGFVPGIAENQSSRPGPSCDDAGAPDAQRKGL